MKSIFNWKLATVFDLEADGFLDVATKLHTLGFQMNQKDVTDFRASTEAARIVKFFKWHIENKIPVVAHNGICFDIPLMEKLFDIDLSELMVIDTLALSWYLNPDRKLHGLDSFHGDYGIAKPKVTDWSDQPYEVYQNRVREDVKINQALWRDLKYRLIEMYTTSKTKIDEGLVGGKRMFEGEVIHLDSLKGATVEEHINRLITFLMFKMDCARLQEKTQWEVDTKLLYDTEAKLEVVTNETKVALELVMPRVAKYSAKKTKPKKCFKKDTTLSTHGVGWMELLRQFEAKETDEHGTLIVIAVEGEFETFKKLEGYDDPNSGSPAQVKALLYSHGWVPQSFKYEKDQELFDAWVLAKPKEGSARGSWKLWQDKKPKEREIPQISIGDGDGGKELCHSVVELAEEIPAISKYAEYNVAKSRLGVVRGWIRDMREGKWLQARIGGFTNTLRVQHRELVNLPGIDKAYGKDCRGCLIAGEGYVLLGSDLSSLEDRVKHHFMLPHDPDYVKTMQEDDFDPHVLMALIAKMISENDFSEFKRLKKLDKKDWTANDKALMGLVGSARKKGKTTNYASVYNAGPAAIARAAGVTLAEGKVLHEAYWKLNWSVKAIADEQVVIRDSKGGKWLINPVNGFCYSLRSEADRFSTLAQGTGSYFFDMWVDNILTEMHNRYKKKTLTGSFHDECIIKVRDNKKFKDEFSEIIQDAIEKVNVDFMVRRKLGCGTEVGYKYSDIH